MVPIKVLVTGANGFVGHAFCREAIMRGFMIRGITQSSGNKSEGVESVAAGCIDGDTDWQKMLDGCEVVVHLAARVHIMCDAARDPLAEFRRINTYGTLNLARQAAAAGVRRFLFISSIKVNGESTQVGHPFKADDSFAPQDAYGISKMEAEQGLCDLALRSGMEVVIIRPPLVYGSGVKANFATMMRWLQRGMPLPLGAIHNHRSLVALDNLIDLMVTCLTHPAAVGQVFLVSDGEDVSTTELLRRMGQTMGRPARLVSVPVSWLKLAAAMLGKQDVVQRLCGSLQVDIEKNRLLLGWCPPFTLDQGLKKAAEDARRDAGM